MMTPQQKLKALILDRYFSMEKMASPVVTVDNVDALYAEHEDNAQDAREEVRCTGELSGLPNTYQGDLRGAHRNYEYDEVADRALDGSWVGWTYWHGGGKHSEPSAIPWIEYAYDINCKEEEKMVVVRTFSKP